MKVSSKKFSQLRIKDKFSFNTIITGEKLNKFINISGDNNPLHANSKFAKDLNFNDKVVHGLLSSAYYSKLVGVYLPGKFSLITKININFHNPLYLNQKINVSGVIVSKDSRFKIISINAQILRKNYLISTAEILVNVKK